jgi:hypothetical protein
LQLLPSKFKGKKTGKNTCEIKSAEFTGTGMSGFFPLIRYLSITRLIYIIETGARSAYIYLHF